MWARSRSLPSRSPRAAPTRNRLRLPPPNLPRSRGGALIPNRAGGLASSPDGTSPLLEFLDPRGQGGELVPAHIQLLETRQVRDSSGKRDQAVGPQVQFREAFEVGQRIGETGQAVVSQFQTRQTGQGANRLGERGQAVVRQPQLPEPPQLAD